MDLNSMFQNLGPAGGAMLTGMQMADTEKAAAMEQQVQNARLQEIMQRAQQTAQTAPLDLKLKEQQLAANDLKSKAEQHKMRTEALGSMIPDLKSIPDLPGARTAYLIDTMHRRGLPLDQADIEHIGKQQNLVKYLEDKHKWAIEEDAKYRKALDLQDSKNAAAMAAAQAKAAAAAQAAAAKAARTATVEQDLSKAKTHQAQSVVYANHAAQARQRGDSVEADRLETLAKQAQANDLKARAAAGDAAAQRQMQLLQGITGGAITPPAAGGAPALPTGWTIKQ